MLYINIPAQHPVPAVHISTSTHHYIDTSLHQHNHTSAPQQINILINFSVLISVYQKEKPEFFSLALESIWNHQVLRPSEIVLVCDGPLTGGLNQIISNFRLKAPLRILRLEENKGLGVALAKGLELCTQDLVARMDSDDISVPDRFEKQIKFMVDHPEIDISGSNIAEFKESTKNICSYRRLPIHSKEILLFARKRNPMNHMTVIFRKSAVIKAGNYLPFHGYEDYYLWIRMIQKGSAFANIPEELVYARIGNNMHSRRRGMKLFLQEIKLLRELLRINFLNNGDYLKGFLFRAFPRLFPVWGIKLVYKILHR